MYCADSARLALLGVCACIALGVSSDAAAADGPEDPAQLLEYADSIKSANHAEFTELLTRLDAGTVPLSSAQQRFLSYLDAWQVAYQGDHPAAIAALNAIWQDPAADIALRVRAGATVVNTLAIATRYEEAYSRLDELLALLPQVTDKNVRLLVIGVAGLLYNQVGQYDLALSYGESWIAEDPDGVGACKGSYVKLGALYRSGKLQPTDRQFQEGLDICRKWREPVYANLIRTFIGNLYIEQGQVASAIRLLKDNYDDAQGTQPRRLTSEFDSMLARAYFEIGDMAQARRYARSSVDKSIRNEITKPLVDAYQVLYQVAKQEGDHRSALTYYEQYAAADKGYLNEATAKALAYQMVNQQVLLKKRQIDGLTEKNQVLRLQQEVAAKSVETERLYVLLLASILGFIVLWGYRTKRSQLRFERLSRRDGLTGILNRQHFMDQAKALLKECETSAREVCLILIDLDNFKSVNDSHGHVAGDVVLQCATAVLQVGMRARDLFGRIGGEEFGVLLPDCPIETARQRAEELRVAIGSMDRAETGIGFDVSASFGVASARESGYDLRQMLIHADSALYRAKREGRNRVATFLVAQSADSAKANQPDLSLAAVKTGA
jgi:diguanylate cyclase (GGDEF)-like protein